MTLDSPLFDIKPTSYGGRGGFAKTDIKSGSTVLICRSPLSSSILRSFKKEVCSWCFHYENGSNLKFKKQGLGHFYFCSENCVENFTKYDVDCKYSEVIVRAEDEYSKVHKRNNKTIADQEDKQESISISKDVIDDAWKQIDEWETKIPKKQQKKLNLIPFIDENEMLELKYAVGCLFEMHREEVEAAGNDEPVRDLNRETFKLLQSDEILKLSKYPYLLESYTRVYKYLKLILSDFSPLEKYLSTATFRDVIGKNLSNAFGIWETSLDGTNKEFFGYSVYPTASFFNHSCAPNLSRRRVGREIHFRADKDISVGTELCITYGNASDESLEVRQKELEEWHFKCQCVKCQTESEKNSIANATLIEVESSLNALTV